MTYDEIRAAIGASPLRASCLPHLRHEWPHIAAEAKVLALFERTKGEPYGWLDLLTQQVLRLPVSSAGWFCSEWCAKALGLTDPEIWSLGMLARHYGAT